MSGVWSRVGRSLLGLFVPEDCPSCAGPLAPHESGGLCAACEAQLAPVPEPFCPGCMEPVTAATWVSGAGLCRRCDGGRYFRRARAAGLFDGLVRDLVTRLKYGGERALAAPLGRWMVQRGSAQLDLRSYHCLVPVPLHRDRLAERGFNQAFLLARPIAAAVRLPIVPALTRSRPTVGQVTLQGQARAENVAGAFALAPEHDAAVRRRRILLVDDVLTTGATAEACARVLREAEADIVDVLTAARAP